MSTDHHHQIQLPAVQQQQQQHPQRDARRRGMGQASRVLAEVYALRETQIHDRGYDAAHDDNYQYGELGDAAACLLAGSPRAREVNQLEWPLDYALWERLVAKPKRDVILTAAALLVAEVERLDRIAHMSSPACQHKLQQQQLQQQQKWPIPIPNLNLKPNLNPPASEAA